MTQYTKLARIDVSGLVRTRKQLFSRGADDGLDIAPMAESGGMKAIQDSMDNTAKTAVVKEAMADIAVSRDRLAKVYQEKLGVNITKSASTDSTSGCDQVSEGDTSTSTVPQVSQTSKTAMLANQPTAPSTAPGLMAQMQQGLAATRRHPSTYNMAASALHPMQAGNITPGIPALGHAIGTGKLGIGPGTGLMDSEAETQPKLASEKEGSWLEQLARRV